MLSKQKQREILGKKVEALRKAKGTSGISGKSADGRLAVVPKWLNKKISNTKLKGKRKRLADKGNAIRGKSEKPYGGQASFFYYI